MKESKNHSRRKRITAVLVTSLLVCMACTLPQTARAAEAGKSQGEASHIERVNDTAAGDATLQDEAVQSETAQDIVIEVVEDIPADTIEDEEVPLAGAPGTATHTGSRVIIPAAVAVVIFFTWLFGRNRRARAEIKLYQD